MHGEGGGTLGMMIDDPSREAAEREVTEAEIYKAGFIVASALLVVLMFVAVLSCICKRCATSNTRNASAYDKIYKLPHTRIHTDSTSSAATTTSSSGSTSTSDHAYTLHHTLAGLEKQQLIRSPAVMTSSPKTATKHLDTITYLTE